ncbi:hypothetical protein [Roseibium salinum]|uniref:Uncharacterized protein n=1 Tax=Roseibium salinum TaxID=1604349 RepID=A0ABT3R3Z2_9HYPH|nr:hypothetical protein [Roseibium sp. DSM 29163]MCX2723933.1 hypothetical protein [Roseibium sp. DSM 29163]MDN3718262.1 hypothetical protein [Roseibium salinum]
MAEKRKAETDRDVRETDLAQQRMGKNRLQGDDQSNVRNERHAVSDVKQEPDDDVIETFEKLDKDKRAREDLNKGVRKSRNTKD